MRVLINNIKYKHSLDEMIEKKIDAVLVEIRQLRVALQKRVTSSVRWP